jgi:acetolactate synthase-1/2/3 large subunit
MRAALRMMTSGRPGPVHLGLPCNFATQPVAQDLLARRKFICANRTFDRAAVTEAARALLDARRPAILAGQGVNLARAWEPLRELAERFQIPVATTFKAKGALPEDHPLSLGVFCNSGDPRVRDFIAEEATDTLLAVGTSLGEVSSCGWDPRLSRKRALLQLDVEPSEIGRNFPVDVPLVGDAAAILTELRFHMERIIQKSEPGVWSGRPRVDMSWRQSPPITEPETGNALKPRTLLDELRRALPREAVLFLDNGTMRTWAGRYFPVYRPNSFFVNMGMASMGYAAAGSIGGRLASGDRPVIALVGDAAFAMNGVEVHTAAEYQIPVVWVVANNGGHGMIYHGERLQFKGKFCSSVFQRRLAVARIANALGAVSMSAQRPGELECAVREAIRLRCPCVIEAAVDLQCEPPMGARVKALEEAMTTAGR